MAYNEALSDRIREALSVIDATVTEKRMFGGVCYMVNGKMCVGVLKEEMMCRIGPGPYEEALERPGCRQMEFTGKPMQGYVLVSDEGIRTGKDFRYWMDLCLRFNPEAKAAKPKRSK